MVGREVDITNQTELARVLGKSGNQFDGVDLLVNAAGVFLPKPFLEQTMEDYDRYLELNRGIFFITQTVARGMAGRVGGSIVNVGSVLGVFDGKGGIACSNSAPCPGAGAR